MSWNVLEALFEQGEDLLLLCSARDNERSSKLRISEAKKWGGDEGKQRFRHIPVGPLEKGDMKHLIARVLGQAETAIDDEFCEQLHERSGGGVPVFCIELLDHIRRNMLYEIDEKGTVRLHLDKDGEQVRILSSLNVDLKLSMQDRYISSAQPLTHLFYCSSLTTTTTTSIYLSWNSRNMEAKASLTKFSSNDSIPLMSMSARSYNPVQFWAWNSDLQM